MTSEQAIFLRDFLLQGIEGEFATTKRVLAAVTDERSDYRPDPKSRTARELAWHIVVAEVVFFNDIARGSLLDGWNGSSSTIIQISFETEGPVRLARRVIRDIVNRDAFAVERR